jgi:RNA methyltransferase, RsmD family
MNVRIIAGRFGGRTIKSPDSFKTHPMSERARSAIFNIIGSEMVDAYVLDAFAGTGALGLESLSRFARRVVFIERDRKASMMLAENIETLGAANSVVAVTAGLGGWLETRDDSERFDVVFSDPPYNLPQWGLVQRLTDLLNDGGLMVVSYASGTKLPELKGVVLEDKREYAGATIVFYRKA